MSADGSIIDGVVVERSAPMSGRGDAQPAAVATYADSRRTTLHIYIFSALFWTAMFVMHTAQMFAMNDAESVRTVAWRFAIAIMTFLMCIPLAWVIRRTMDWPMTRRVLAIGAACAPPAMAYSAVGYVVWYVMLQAAEPLEDPIASMAWQAQYYFILFVLWSVFCSAILYAARLQDRERRLLHAQSLAHEAELKMLRYQINPHFLFNTLNAVSALIVTGQPQAAEAMVGKLSQFFRNALSRESSAKVTLAEDVRVQLEYLSIEQVRFPDRVRWAAHIDPDVEHALVPHLILQPLFENAVKHGVARSAAPVEIRLDARREGARLVVAVENDVRRTAEDAPNAGEGVGLRNVARRLASFYGAEAFMQAARLEQRFRVELQLPLELTL